MISMTAVTEGAYWTERENKLCQLNIDMLFPY